MKVQTFDEGNSSQVQLLNGLRFKSSIEKYSGMYYDDSLYFTFSNPSNSAQAAIQTYEDILDPDHTKMLRKIQ